MSFLVLFTLSDDRHKRKQLHMQTQTLEFKREFSFGSLTDWQHGSGCDLSYIYGLSAKKLHDGE